MHCDSIAYDLATCIGTLTWQYHDSMTLSMTHNHLRNLSKNLRGEKKKGGDEGCKNRTLLTLVVVKVLQ